MLATLKRVLASASSAPEKTAPALDGEDAAQQPYQHQPVSRVQRHTMGQRPVSLIDHLPWMDYLPEKKVFVLEDGVSLAALYELIPTATEGRSKEFLKRQADALQTVLNGAFPEVEKGDWVMQIFVQDDPGIDAAVAHLEAYIDPEIRTTAFTQDYLARMRKHLQIVARREGLFTDNEVSGNRFCAKLRRTRVCIYRRYPSGYDFNEDGGLTAAEQLDNITDRFEGALAQAGVRTIRQDRKHLYEWLVPWFNPAPALPEGTDLLQVMPYPGEGPDAPFGYDFCEQLFMSMPRSDADRGLWWFDGMPHQVLTLQALRQPPVSGHLTAERSFKDGRLYALFDKLPEGAILSISISFRAQDKVRDHIDKIKRASVGDSADAQLAKEQAIKVSRRIARGDKVLPTVINLYLRGSSEEDLRRRVNSANAVLLPADLKFIDRQADLLAVDSWIRGLPMAFDPVLDQKESLRSRFLFSSHLAALLPLYGRARGTGRPAWWFFNRGGEPVMMDPLHRADRKKNAHLLLLGPTGAGKSATCNSLTISTLAVHRPRFIIADAGNSFGLLGQHCASLGLTVNHVVLNPDSDVSLPPFADAYKLLDAVRPELTELPFDELDESPAPLSDDEPEAAETDTSVLDEKRDILGEMEIAARIMITGGDPREAAKLTRADQGLIRRAIKAAARKARDAGKPMMLTEDVVEALADIARDPELPEVRRGRVSEMSDAMRLFCDGIAGRFFNRAGQGWPDADVTIVDFGILAREGYEDQLTIAYISLINYANALAEARQYEKRATVVLTDEAHIVTTNPMLSPYIVKISKMWRKLGVWLWLATQNMQDFPDTAKRMLNMMEWWMLLVMPNEEVEQLSRFRTISKETRDLLLSAKKQMGAFTEGVVLSDQVECLVRNVPPSLALALAQTEKDEKADRAKIMRERGCTELEAVYEIADRLDKSRVIL